jgi:hypothetical protein
VKLAKKGPGMWVRFKRNLLERRWVTREVRKRVRRREGGGRMSRTLARRGWRNIEWWDERVLGREVDGLNAVKGICC